MLRMAYPQGVSYCPAEASRPTTAWMDWRSTPSEEDLKGTKMTELGPGVYLKVKDHGMKDNSISSIRLVKPMGR